MYHTYESIHDSEIECKIKVDREHYPKIEFSFL